MMRQLRRGHFSFDIIGRARLWFAISAIVILVSIGSMVFRGFNAGLEFTGGTSYEVQAEAEDVSVADIRSAIAGVGIEESTVQRVGDQGFLIQTAHADDDTQRAASEAIAEAAGIETVDVNITDVGPKWGQQITNKALRALIIFLVVAVIYISIRLEPKMAGTALVALFHDLIVTAGVYSLTGFVVTPATVIAFLTVLGYSLYDTVVIFDRVKENTENLSVSGSTTFATAVNGSVNQVLVRSINTSITSLLPVGSLLVVGSYLLGARTLRELALALFIGLSAGTYSSVFIAAPVLALWKEREARWSMLRARIAARGGEAVSTPAPVAATPTVRSPDPATANLPPELRPPPVRAKPSAADDAKASAGGGNRKKGISSQPKGSSSRNKRRKKRKRRKR